MRRTVLMVLKNINMPKLLVLFLLVMMTGPVFSVDQTQVPVKHKILKTDSSQLIVRHFDSNKLGEYRSKKEFIYDDVPVVNDGLWSRFWRWFWKQINGLLSNKISGSVIKYVVIILVIVLVIFLVIRFIGMDMKIISGKSKSITVPYEESMDNIHEISFEEEIEKAIAMGNYRLAVRLFYLRTLKVLNDRGLIDWQPEKTNQIYINEIKEEGNKQRFVQLTRQFEYVWYGEFFIDKEAFSNLKKNFDHFNLPGS